MRNENTDTMRAGPADNTISVLTVAPCSGLMQSTKTDMHLFLFTLKG